MEGKRYGFDPKFWDGKRVLLTGHTGFKGAWLSLWLKKMGAHVWGIAKDPRPNSIFTSAVSGDDIDNDIRLSIPQARGYLESIVCQAKPDVVIHMAAQAIVLDSYTDPFETYNTNVMGTLVTLDMAKKSGAKATVVVTSDKCYENVERPEAYREGDRLGGHDPYSSSKACCEILASSWHKSFGTPLATARAGNVIGGGDRAPFRLVPDLLDAFLSGGVATLRNPDAMRPWQHVLEPLSGYLCLARGVYEERFFQHGEAFNFAPRREDCVSVLDLAERLSKITGGRFESKPDGPRQREATLLVLDASKAKDKLGWVPTWGIQTALEMTARWEMEKRAGSDMRAETLRQIELFESESK